MDRQTGSPSARTRGGANAAGVKISPWTRSAAGGSFKEVANTTSNAAGDWKLTAPRGTSRTIHIVAGPDAKDARVAREVAFAETVTPVLTLHLATPGRRRIVFWGSLDIAPLGDPHPLVLPQTRGPDGWEVVGSPVRVNRTGHYRYTYLTSPLTLGRRFQFRATTPQTASWQEAKTGLESAVIH